MERDNIEEVKYLKAKKRVEKIKGFYIHCIVTVFLIPFLIILNLQVTPDFHWFWFAVGGVLLGVFFHWLGLFGSTIFLGKNWEEKKIEEFMND